MTNASTGARCCNACAHLVDDAAELERTFSGLSILSSAHGESRGDQGLCRLHATLVTPGLVCDGFCRRAGES